MLSRVLVIAILLSTASCAVGPDYKQKQWDVGEDFNASKEATTSNLHIKSDWWKVFNDPLLTKIVEESIEKNNDIKFALANIEEAKALRSSAIGGFFPTITGGSEGRKTKASSKISSVGEGKIYSAGLDASWELDIWGKTRRELESASASLQSAKEERHDILLAVIAEVARNYFEVRGMQKRVDFLKRSAELAKEVEKLAEAKMDAGEITGFEIASARGEREEIEAGIPNLEAEIKAGIYRLSVLSGELPEYYMSKLYSIRSLPSPPDIVPIGLRSEILRRRPDVRKAERDLAAATAEIGVKTAELFPSISLTGAVGTSARVFGDLFAGGAGTYSVGGLVNGAIFEGGANIAELKAAKARHSAEFTVYEQTVLKALEDVESSLARYGSEQRTLKRLLGAENSRREGFEIAKLRYAEGEEDFLVILDAERSLISVQNDVIESRVRVLTRLTQLYKALGGGWEGVN